MPYASDYTRNMQTILVVHSFGELTHLLIIIIIIIIINITWICLWQGWTDAGGWRAVALHSPVVTGHTSLAANHRDARQGHGRQAAGVSAWQLPGRLRSGTQRVTGGGSVGRASDSRAIDRRFESCLRQGPVSYTIHSGFLTVRKLIRTFIFITSFTFLNHSYLSDSSPPLITLVVNHLGWRYRW